LKKEKWYIKLESEKEKGKGDEKVGRLGTKMEVKSIAFLGLCMCVCELGWGKRERVKGK